MSPPSLEAAALAAASAVVNLGATTTHHNVNHGAETSALRSYIPPRESLQSTMDFSSGVGRSGSRVTSGPSSVVSAPPSPPRRVPSASSLFRSSVHSYGESTILKSPSGSEYPHKARRLSSTAPAVGLPRFSPVNYSVGPSANPGRANGPSSANNGNLSVRRPVARSHGRSLSLSHANSQTRTAYEPLNTNLMQLSQVAALRDRISEDPEPEGLGTSRKRSADGLVKDARSPKRHGHARSRSTVSMGSPAVGKIGELSAELRTKLSYAMIKVNHGWQSHSIDEVESLASHAVSPASSNSTPRNRPASSASPGLSSTGHSTDQTTTPASQDTRSQQSPPYFFAKPETLASNGANLGLAPPAPIQPEPRAFPPPPSANNRGLGHMRRHSRAGYTPTLLSSHALPLSAPQTPGSASMNRRLSCSQIGSRDSNMLSPHQNFREQDAIETLLFMSSPKNTPGLRSGYPGSLASPRGNPTPLRTFGSLSGASSAPPSQLQFPNQASPRQPPTRAQQRKALPTGRPSMSNKRVGFEEESGSRRAILANGGQVHLTLPLALDRPREERRRLADDEIDRMLEQAAAEESDDDEEEIHIPGRMMARAQAV